MPITIRTAFQPSVPLTVSDAEYVGLDRRGLVYAIDTGQSIALPTNGALMTVNIRTTNDPGTVITVSEAEFADLFRQHLVYSIENGGPIDYPDFSIGQYLELGRTLAKNPDLLIVGGIVRNSDGVITSGVVAWLDGTAGTFTTDSIDPTGAINGYHITYGANPVIRTYTQPTITRDSSGAATNVPQIVVS